MGKNIRPIPNSSAKKILEEFGAKHVSSKASEEFALILTDLAKKISFKSVELAKHAKRKTILDEDIKLASKML